MFESQKFLLNTFKQINPFKLINTNNLSNFNIFFKSTATFSTKTVSNSSQINNTTFNIQQSYVPITVLNIKDNKGARFTKTKLGRGPGSGKGKTSGRGHKGFKARVGNPNRHYEGGQVPVTRRLPKHGFRRNAVKLFHSYINLDKIYYLIQKGRLNPMEPITSRHVFWAGGVSKIGNGVKILSRGSEFLKDLPPLHLEVTSASGRAIEVIKQHGGTVTCVYKNRLTMRAQAKPWKFYKPLLDPVPKYKMVKKLLELEDKGAM
jgi:large subunit ribosomal protein L15